MAEYITWKPYYSVGDDSLDTQHKVIIGLINELYAAVLANRPDVDLKGIMDRLLRYTITHFQHEEQLMLECGFPDLQAHKLLHERLRQQHSRSPRQPQSRHRTGPAAVPERLVVRTHSGERQGVLALSSTLAQPVGPVERLGQAAARQQPADQLLQKATSTRWPGEMKIGRRLPAVGRKATPTSCRASH